MFDYLTDSYAKRACDCTENSGGGSGAVMAVMTAGCGTKGQPAGDATGTKDGTKQTTGANPGTADAAKGRYVEQAVAYPFEDGTEGFWILFRIRTGDGPVYLSWPGDGRKKESLPL